MYFYIWNANCLMNIYYAAYDCLVLLSPSRFAYSMKSILITHFKHHDKCLSSATLRYVIGLLCPRLTSSCISIAPMPFLGSLMLAWC